MRSSRGGSRGVPANTALGVSLTELLIVIAVIGVLAAIAIPRMGSVREGAAKSAAMNSLESLNRAVNHHNQAWREIEVEAASGWTDELEVVEELQTPREVANGIRLPGSPFLDARYQFVPSDDPTSYRAQWDGSYFSLLRPGESGAGLDLIVRVTEASIPVEEPEDPE